MNFEEKLSNVELRIKDPSLKAEYYIFDYEPEYELKVRCIITDTEDALIYAVNNVFNNAKRSIFKI